MSDPNAAPAKVSRAKAAGFSSTGPALDLRDHLYFLDLTLDVESQLRAIHGLLNRNLQADKALEEEIKEVEDHARKLEGMVGERAVDEWLDRLHHSVYQDAAHSMAAVGMLAPLIESIFAQSFQSIGSKFFTASQPVTTHARWSATHQIQWDCHLVITEGRSRADLVSGIAQLADATGLSSRLPADIKATLAALFAYRNKMFHLGFEWPLAERVAFAARITEEHWPTEWFSRATSGTEPWIFYMSTQFIDHVIETIYRVLDGLAAYVRDELLPRRIELEKRRDREVPS